MKAATAPAPPIRLWIWGLLVTIIALLTRLKPMGDVFQDYALVPFGPDTSYHLWRIVETVAVGAPPRFDPFLNAPFGARVIWPDGFDGALGCLIRLLLGSDAERAQIEAAALLILPVLGTLGVWVSYLLARQVASRPIAMLAAGLAAMLPAHLMLAVVGRIDHHLLEAILPAISLVLICRTATSAKNDWRTVGLGGALAGIPLALLIFGSPPPAQVRREEALFH